MDPLKAFRNMFNRLGFAWWVEIQTDDPIVTYWFGPFLTKKSLNGALSVFLEDLTLEGSKPLDHSITRSRRSEPLTI
tara:strand:+ start:433 stop:663 length:231 start_codon:yes stop_codon:yes gene_type:complete